MNFFSGKSFRHGIHPPDTKAQTRGSAIHQFPFAPLLIVPLSQHIGNPAIPLVGEGDEVTRGQCIARPDGFVSVAIHAPATGTVRRIGLSPGINGKMSPAIFLEAFAASTQEPVADRSPTVLSHTAEQIIDSIQQAGVVGLGGAGFPTHAKIRIPEDKHVDTLVINGAECEPYLTTDHRVMLENTDDVIGGIELLMKACGAEKAVIAVEANKPDAAEKLRATIPTDAPIDVEVLPVKYPQGAEKMLITALLGREIKPGGLPLDVHAICINVGTAAEVGKLLPSGMGLQERVVTVSGPGIERKGNYRVPIGTPLRFILEHVGTTSDITSVVMGGPMMGSAASSLEIPITKGSTGVIALTQRETGPMRRRKEFPCIHCGHCVDACPLFLNPSQLGLLAKRGDYQSMADRHHLRDCFECGCCTYVCPSHIPLVQHFRVAKAALAKSGRAAG